MEPGDYLTTIKNRISDDSIVFESQILREYSTSNNAHIRIRLTFTDNSYLEFYEYVEQTENGDVYIKTYSYHWADQDDRLIRRWDNTKHFPNLDNFPHHIHVSEEQVISGKPINIFDVLDEIAKTVGNGDGV